MTSTVRSSTACVFYAIGSRYTYEAAEIARRAGVEIAAFVDNLDGTDFPEALGPVLHASALDPRLLAYPACIPLITPGYRKHVEFEARSHGFVGLASLVDPTSVVAESARVDDGLQINAGVVIGANGRFGKLVLVNRGASIGHDAVVEAYATIGPGSVVCGGCRIRAGAFVGAGASIAPDIEIGRNSVVGIGSVVVKDVPEGVVVAGNPARVIQRECAGYNDVGV